MQTRNYQTLFDLCYSTRISESIKRKTLEMAQVPLNEDIEIPHDLVACLEFLDTMTYSNLSKETVDELIDRAFEGLSEEYIEEIYEAYVKLKVYAYINEDTPIGLVGVRKENERREAAQRKAEARKQAFRDAIGKFKSGAQKVGQTAVDKVKGAVGKVKDWYNKATDDDRPIGLSRMLKQDSQAQTRTTSDDKPIGLARFPKVKAETPKPQPKPEAPKAEPKKEVDIQKRVEAHNQRAWDNYNKGVEDAKRREEKEEARTDRKKEVAELKAKAKAKVEAKEEAQADRKKEVDELKAKAKEKVKAKAETPKVKKSKEVAAKVKTEAKNDKKEEISKVNKKVASKRKEEGTYGTKEGDIKADIKTAKEETKKEAKKEAPSEVEKAKADLRVADKVSRHKDKELNQYLKDGSGYLHGDEDEYADAMIARDDRDKALKNYEDAKQKAGAKKTEEPKVETKKAEAKKEEPKVEETPKVEAKKETKAKEEAPKPKKTGEIKLVDKIKKSKEAKEKEAKAKETPKEEVKAEAKTEEPQVEETPKADTKKADTKKEASKKVASNVASKKPTASEILKGATTGKAPSEKAQNAAMKRVDNDRVNYYKNMIKNVDSEIAAAQGKPSVMARVPEMQAKKEKYLEELRKLGAAV